MPDSLVSMIKKTALEAVDNENPVRVIFGTVESASPLEIRVSQKVVLTDNMLLLTRTVTDYEIDLSVSHWTEYEKEHQHSVTTGGTALPTTHRHQYKGKKKFKVHNALVEGDQVMLLRVQGAKKYVVVDRIAPHPKIEGEWV